MEVISMQAALKKFNYLDLQLYHLGYARLDPQWHGSDSVYPVNRLYLPSSGSAIIKVGMQEITMEQGYAYLIPPGAVLDYACPEEMEKIYIHFNLYRPDRYDVLQGKSMIYTIPFSKENYDRLLACALRGTMEDTLFIREMMYQLIARYQSTFSLISEEVPIYSRLVMNTITTIQQNLSANLALEDLARQNFISRSTLAEQFKREVGLSLGKYIDDQLMSAAQRMLCQTTKSIGEISAALGYSNQCYFSRRFKQLCHMTPQLYRIRNKV